MTSLKKYLFVDRDGTLIIEPDDFQVDQIDKIALLPKVIPALLQLQRAGYQLVMISNQDGLGTDSFPQQDFQIPHNYMLDLFQSQGIEFVDTLICPHWDEDNCSCRKPKPGLVMPYLRATDWDREASYLIGDRITDCQLADEMGIQSIQIGSDNFPDWEKIVNFILFNKRIAKVSRKTNETNIQVSINLDKPQSISINTGIGFFDHMLEQLAKHGGFSMDVQCQGDLHIDDHHSVEDTALTIGEALRKALGDKLGINRFGFLLPMDDTLCQVALDLSGRPYVIFDAKFSNEKVGDLATELVPHFYRSLGESLGANLNIQIKGDNTHHMVEASFKALGRTLRQAIQQNGYELPSTKGAL